MADTYAVEACYPNHAGIGTIDADGWLIVCTGGRERCLGYLEARRDVRGPRPAQRVRHLPTGRICDDLPALDGPAFGMVAGWPTVDQRIGAALSALAGIGLPWRLGDPPSPGLVADVETAIALLKRHKVEVGMGERLNGLHAGGEHHEWVHDGRVIAAYGPNPYGLMGQGWTRGWRFDADGRQSATTVGPKESTVRDWFNATPCPECSHPIGSHDPEDGTCDRHAEIGFGVCRCGRGEVPRD